MIIELVYFLCGMMSSICAYLLIKKYRKTHSRLLLWSSLCFLCLALNNIILFADMIIFPVEVDLSVWRTIPLEVGVFLLIYGLVKETV